MCKGGRVCTSQAKSYRACISPRLFWMGVPLRITRTPAGTVRSACTSFVLAFLTLWPCSKSFFSQHRL